MVKSKELESLLEELGIELAEPVVSHMGEPNRFFAFVKLVYGKGSRRSPSQSRINAVRKVALEAGYNVDLVPVDERSEDNYPDLWILLSRKYGEKVRNVFLTYAGSGEWIVWVEVDGELEDTQRDEIESTVSEYMAISDTKVREVTFVGDFNLPTLTAILRHLRVLAPVNPERLKEALEERQFFVPDQRWLNRTLDRIRKAGFVVRRKDGRYFLSVKSLSSLGTSKGRESADVRRALALSKRLH